MKYILILLLLASCVPSKPVNQYYIGFRKTGKASQIVAIPRDADTSKWVILQTVDLRSIQ